MESEKELEFEKSEEGAKLSSPVSIPNEEDTDVVMGDTEPNLTTNPNPTINSTTNPINLTPESTTTTTTNNLEPTTYPYPLAPTFPVPTQKYLLVEYPGPVQNVPLAVRTLGGIEQVIKCYNEKDATWGLKYRPDDPFCHSIRGHTVATKNFLLKITRKVLRRKRTPLPPNSPTPPAPPLPSQEWYHVLSVDYSIVGIIEKTVRFRSLADFYHRPSDPLADRLFQFHDALENLNIQNLSQSFSDLNRYFKENQSRGAGVEFLPPPLFSRQMMPFQYKYQQVDGLKKDLAKEQLNAQGINVAINTLKRQRTKVARNFYSRSYTDLKVPLKPTEEMVKASQRIPEATLEKGRKLFQERPIWTIPAFLNQFDSIANKDSKLIFPALAYFLMEGPWLSVWVRYGYDPRNHPEARLYQTIRTRRMGSLTEKNRSTQHAIRQDSRHTDPERDRKFHIFDTKRLPSQILTFQICDIHYPRIDRYVTSPAALNSSTHPRYGWYKEAIYKRIHALVTSKYHQLLKEQKQLENATHETESGIPQTLNRKEFLPSRPKFRDSDEEGSDTDVEELINREEQAWPLRTPVAQTAPSLAPFFPDPRPDESSSHNLAAYLFSSTLDPNTAPSSVTANLQGLGLTDNMASDQLRQLNASLQAHPNHLLGDPFDASDHSDPDPTQDPDLDVDDEDDDDDYGFDDNLSLCGSTLEYLDRSDGFDSPPPDPMEEEEGGEEME